MPISSVLLALFAASAAPAQDSLVAPADCWMTWGGNPARTAASAGSALRGPVAEAWVHDAGASIVGEPLVWDEVVVLELDLGDGKRALRGLDLSTGEKLTTRDHSVASPVTLEPGLWQSDVCFRDSERSLAGLRLWRGTAFPRWNYRVDDAVGPPLFVDGEVYVCVGDGTERLQFGDNDPVWRTEGPFRGRVSLHGQSVFVMSHDARGNFYVVELDRRDGTEIRRAFFGNNEPGLSHADLALPTIALYNDLWGASLPSPFSFYKAKEVHGMLIDPNGEKAKTRSSPLPGSGGWTTLPSLILGEAGTVGRMMSCDSKSGKRTLLHISDLSGKEVRTIANSDSNPDFAAHDAGVTVLRDGIYVGGRAFDQASLEVLWRHANSKEISSRAVPARDSALYVRGENELVCLRQAFVVMEEVTGNANSPRDLSNTPLETDNTTTTWNGRVVLRPSAVEEGESALRGGASWISFPLSRALWCELRVMPTPIAFSRGKSWLCWTMPTLRFGRRTESTWPRRTAS